MTRIQGVLAAVGATALVFLVAMGPLVYGQGGGQAISGIVMDPLGAPVAGASVTVTNLANGTKVVLSTNSAGFFSTPPDQTPGVEYRIDVSKPGFERLQRRGVILHLAETLRLNLPLTVGALVQTVEVNAAAPVLNTEDASLGTVVDQQAVANLPMQSRRMGGLIGIGPGVNYEGEDANSFTAPRFNMAGSTNEVLSIDGADGSQGRTNVDQMELNPPLDSVQEVQIQQSYYSAEYGGAEGGMVRITTKSGTNQFHGTGYEYFRNETLDTRQFFAAAKSPDNYNLFGGSIGGPVRKDRLFFFADVEGTKQGNPSSGPLTVPTVAERSGNFQDTGTAIYDPSTTQLDPNNSGQYIRAPFPNDVIPSSVFDPIAVKALAFLPNVTIPGANNVPVTWNNNVTRHGWAGKVDYYITQKDQFTFSTLGDRTSLFSTQFDTTGGTPAFTKQEAVPDPNATTSAQMTHAYIFSETHIFSPTLVNTVRVAKRKIFAAYTPAGQESGIWTSYFGLQNTAQDLGFPEFRFSGYEGIGPGVLVLNTAAQQGDWEWHDTLQSIHGKHTFKFGGDAEHTFSDTACGSNATGAYNFDQRLTNNPETGSGGNSIASFLLGEVSSGNVSNCPLPPKYFTETYIASYAEDSIRVNPRLTLDFGLRWEVDLPLYEKENRGNGFDPFTINPVSGTPGVITFQGETGVPLGFYAPDWTRFEPRFGFAFQLDSKTVIRGGYGIYGQTLALGTNRGAPGTGFQPINASFSTPDNGVTPAFILRKGFPAYPIGATPASLNNAFGAVPAGQNPTTSLSYVPYYWNQGYAENSNISVQREVARGTLVEIAGISGLGRRLSMQVAKNEVPPNLWGLAGNSQVRRPFPQFGSITDVEDATGTTDYYAGTAKVSKHTQKGLFLLSSFTWQKEVGVANNFQSDDYHNLSRGLTIFDLSNGPHGIPAYLFRVSAVYDLPAGRGRHYLTSGPASWILGGWTAGGIFTYTSGYPFGITSNGDSLNCQCGAGGRVNQVLGQPVMGAQTPQQWFNPLLVVAPVFGQIGTMGISPPGLVGPPLRNLDISLVKVFAFTERYSAKISLEAFNVTNTPQFGLPNTTLGTPGFDTISSARGNGSGSSFSPPWDLSRIMQVGFRFEW
jgi:hypothetical protein